MSYKQATKFYQIPVLGFHDKIIPKVEKTKWQIVENLILAATRGNVNAIFREGDYRIKTDINGKFCVTLSSTGNEPSLQGSVGGAFFEAPTVITWGDLEVGNVYYLYVKGSSKTFLDEKNITTVSSVTSLISPNVTLVAKVFLQGDTFRVDQNPPGKVNTKDLVQHVLDWDNPHGLQLVQSEMMIRDRLLLGDNNNMSFEFDVDGVITTLSLSQILNKLKAPSVQIVDFVSGGKTGTLIEANSKILFVNIMNISVDNLLVGDVSIGLNGIDPNVNDDKHVVIKNSGDIGVQMRASLQCE